MSLQNARTHALKVTSEAIGSFVYSHFHHKKLQFERKADGSVVTAVDSEAEVRARDMLLEQFPNDGFLGEEHGEIEGTSGYRWVVDPIDGTASFVRGVPLFGSLIGLEFEGEPIGGAANLPAIHESVWAVVGEGAFDHDGNKIKVSAVASLADSMICTTSFEYYKQTNCEHLHDALLKHTGSIRGWSDCFAYLLLCTGRIDAVVEPLLYPWDIVPWLPIINESGGCFSPIAQGGIASNHTIHDSLYDALHDKITN